MHRSVLALQFCLLFHFLTWRASAADLPQEVTIPAGRYQLHGCFWTPDGPGPFAVMVFNHGSEKNPAPCGPPDLGSFYQKKGFAFFTVQRHGHGASPGEYIIDLQRQAFRSHPLDRSVAEKEAVELQELYNKDVEAAVTWLKAQTWVDAQRIAMTGISFGGIQTLLTAEKGLGIRAFLAFAPAAQSWNPALADRLKAAVRRARAPIFIIQAQNDYSLEPSKVLGAELEKKMALRIAQKSIRRSEPRRRTATGYSAPAATALPCGRRMWMRFLLRLCNKDAGKWGSWRPSARSSRNCMNPRRAEILRASMSCCIRIFRRSDNRGLFTPGRKFWRHFRTKQDRRPSMRRSFAADCSRRGSYC
jgi:dienelactone hydrolase